LTRVLGLSTESLPWAMLGEFPTPITQLPSGATMPSGVGFVKRDDLSSNVYGGNKVRTLEVLFGDALERQSRAVFATGAYGSNHAVATALHAQRVGLSARAILFPQPISWAALENLRVTLEVSDKLYALPHFGFLPFRCCATRTDEIWAGSP
jgi:D-cysteine desulfhydrase